ncbi:MAG: CsiV family protein [Pseudomonadota bacterium]
MTNGSPADLFTAGTRRRLTAAAALLGALSVGTTVQAAQDATSPEELRDGRYFKAELIVFARGNISEEQTRETLTRPMVTPLPARTAAFLTDAVQHPYALTPQTQSMLDRTASRLPVTWPLPPLDQAPPVSAIPMATEPSGESAAGPADVLAPDTQNALTEQTLATLEQDLVLALEDEAQVLREASYRFATGDLKRLNAVRARLERRYDILLAGSWLQPVPPRDAPQPLLLQAGNRYGDDFQLQGIVELTVSRYLHFRTQLAYYEPELGSYLVPIEDASQPAVTSAEPVTPETATPTLDSASATGAQAPAPLFERRVPQGHYFMELAQQRRMRSAELHYLDHPKFGVLIRVDPVPASDAVTAAWSALKALDRPQ